METMEFSRKVGFLSMHVFAYSPREGTPAALYDGQLPESVKRERSEALICLADELGRERKALRIEKGSPLSVLFETERKGTWRGHSDTFFEVEAPTDADLHGQICLVSPLSVKDGRIQGKLI